MSAPSLPSPTAALTAYFLASSPSERRAQRATTRSQSFLAMASAGRDGVRASMGERTKRRRLAELRAAGIAPVTDASVLAALAAELGIDDAGDLENLVAVLNSDTSRSPASASRRWGSLVAEALVSASAKASSHTGP